MVNTRVAASNSAFLSPSRQDTMMTDDTDMLNVMNDVEINGEEDIDNVSVGGMDVSDIEDTEHHNGHADHADPQPQGGVGRVRPTPSQRPPTLGRQQQQRQQQQQLQRQQQQQQQRQQQPPQLQQQQPRPPGGPMFRPAPPHPPPTAPSYTHPLVGGVVVCVQCGCNCD